MKKTVFLLSMFYMSNVWSDEPRPPMYSVPRMQEILDMKTGKHCTKVQNELHEVHICRSAFPISPGPQPGPQNPVTSPKPLELFLNFIGLYPDHKAFFRKDADLAYSATHEAYQIQDEKIAEILTGRPLGFPLILSIQPQPETYVWATSEEHISWSSEPQLFKGTLIVNLANCVMTRSTEDEYWVYEQMTDHRDSFKQNIEQCVEEQLLLGANGMTSVFQRLDEIETFYTDLYRKESPAEEELFILDLEQDLVDKRYVFSVVQSKSGRPYWSRKKSYLERTSSVETVSYDPDGDYSETVCQKELAEMHLSQGSLEGDNYYNECKDFLYDRLSKYREIKISFEQSGGRYDEEKCEAEYRGFTITSSEIRDKSFETPDFGGETNADEAEIHFDEMIRLLVVCEQFYVEAAVFEANDPNFPIRDSQYYALDDDGKLYDKRPPDVINFTP